MLNFTSLFDCLPLLNCKATSECALVLKTEKFRGMWHLEVAVLGGGRCLSHDLLGVCRSYNGMGRDRARELSRN